MRIVGRLGRGRRKTGGKVGGWLGGGRKGVNGNEYVVIRTESEVITVWRQRTEKTHVV